jgi:predicted nucleic acid-binding protein
MEKICLDFETAFDFLRGDLTVVEKLRNYADREEICITSIAMTHLMVAITKPEAVRAFLNSVTVLPFDQTAAQAAARISMELNAAGDYEKGLDAVMTAAVCISNKAYLFSRSPTRYEGIKTLKKV